VTMKTVCCTLFLSAKKHPGMSGNLIGVREMSRKFCGGEDFEW